MGLAFEAKSAGALGLWALSLSALLTTLGEWNSTKLKISIHSPAKRSYLAMITSHGSSCTLFNFFNK